jgi:ABC-type bacteriocin/lantibiotic exporter with double-glycine peptidase domain
LDFVARRYRKSIVTYVEDRKLYNFFRRLPISKRIKIVQANIDLQLIERLIKCPLIIYVDAYLFRNVHYPHFVVVWKLDKSKFLITDPWDGKMKKLAMSSLLKGIKLLKNTLKFSPQIIERLS